MTKRILSEIWIYPVKSLGGIRLKSSTVMEKGLRDDRRWMLVDESGKFLTQRFLPKMALFNLSKVDRGYKVQFGDESILLPPMPDRGTTRKARIWTDEVEVIAAETDVSNWFADRLGIACHLVAFPEKNTRPVDPQYRLANESVSLADGYPILIIGRKSLDDLNARMESPVGMNRFRPNLIFSGGEAYEEDQWRTFRVGTSTLVGVKPCGRCVLTTVDPATGVMGKEPLLTLSRYRKQNEKINFGQNVIPTRFGEISEGDEIHLL